MIRHAALVVLAAAILGAEPGPRPPAVIGWRTDETAALAESLRSGRPLLVDAWAEWCGGCKLLDLRTWSDPGVRGEVQRRFVPLRVDLTEEGTIAETRMRALGLTALPAVLICMSRGCNATSPRAVGFRGPAEMLAFLRARPGPAARSSSP